MPQMPWIAAYVAKHLGVTEENILSALLTCNSQKTVPNGKKRLMERIFFLTSTMPIQQLEARFGDLLSHS